MEDNHPAQHEEEASSEFSYMPSETMHNLSIDEAKRNLESALLRKNEPLTLSSISDSQHRDQAATTIPKPELTPITKESPFSSNHSSPDFKPFHAPHLPSLPADYRESYLSTFSQYSGVPTDVGTQAIPVTITRHDSGKANEKSKLVLINPDIPQISTSISKPQSEISEIDSETIKIGKLPTIRGPKSSAHSSPKSEASSSNQLKPDVSYNTTIEGSVPPRSPRRPKSEILSSIQQTELSKEINEFNKNKILSSHNKRNSAQISDDLDQLMKSLRRESSSFTDEAHSHNDQIDTKSIKSAKSRDISDFGTEDTTEPLSPQPHPSAGSIANTDPLPKVRGVPPRPSTENLIKAREVSESLQNQKAPSDPLHESQSNHPPPPHNQVNQDVPLPTHPGVLSDSTNVQPQSNLNNEDYYDIGPPELVHRPSRVKSVKESTKQHHHDKKSKSIKSKKKKTSRDSSELKPFSYHTLINLLESMNGTIIGEEFSQLNLPIKEKQLIEKIVDSLSRLTSDMVIDKNRYDIGIQRLEKALRVLEGFM